MKKILFVGDDLYNNGQEKIDELKEDRYGEEALSRNAQVLVGFNEGIYLISENADEIYNLSVTGKVCRTYQNFLDELINLDNYDHIVVDLNFQGGSEKALQELAGFTEKANLSVLYETGARVRGHVMGGPKWTAQSFFEDANVCFYGPLVISKLQKMKKPFTIFTRDVVHATRAFVLLASIYPDINELVEFINSMDKFDILYFDDEFLLFSTSKKIAAGTKYSIQVWKDFLKEIM